MMLRRLMSRQSLRLRDVLKHEHADGSTVQDVELRSSRVAVTVERHVDIVAWLSRCGTLNKDAQGHCASPRR